MPLPTDSGEVLPFLRCPRSPARIAPIVVTGHPRLTPAHRDGAVATRSDFERLQADTRRGRPNLIKRYSSAAMEYVVRQARTGDVPEIRRLVDQNAGSGRLLDKHTVSLYEDILEFTVAEASADRSVAGCGALHVMWEDLAELRTVAVDERSRGAGIGHRIVDELLDRARAVGVSRVFVLTFAVSFFASHGFTEISGTPVSPEVYAELLRSYDDGVAEFLDLDRVKPNTLGNTRMLLRLLSPGRDYPRCRLDDCLCQGRRRPGTVAARWRVECLVRVKHQSCPVAVACPRQRGRPRLTTRVGVNVHDAGSRHGGAVGDCLRRLSDRRMGDRAPGTGPQAPGAGAGRRGHGRAGRRARGPRARQKLTFRNIGDLPSSSAGTSAWQPMPRQITTG